MQGRDGSGIGWLSERNGQASVPHFSVLY